MTTVNQRNRSNLSTTKTKVTARSPININVPKTVSIVKQQKGRVGVGQGMRRGSQSASKRSLTRSVSQGRLQKSCNDVENINGGKQAQKTTQMVMWGCNMSNQLGIRS